MSAAQEYITDERSCRPVVGGSFEERRGQSICTLAWYEVVQTRHIVIGDRIELVVDGDFRNRGIVVVQGRLDLKGQSQNLNQMAVEQGALFVNNGVLEVWGGRVLNRGEMWNADELTLSNGAA